MYNNALKLIMRNRRWAKFYFDVLLITFIQIFLQVLLNDCWFFKLNPERI